MPGSLSAGNACASNLLVQADNAIALEALRDPRPGACAASTSILHNNNERYAHYDDTLSHEDWLQEIEGRPVPPPA